MPRCDCTFHQAKRREKHRPGILDRYRKLLAWNIVLREQGKL